MMTATPWAMLLAKFAGDDAEPFPRSYFEDVFTTAGAGRWNIPDYFNDVSHGRVDLSGSKVFGWFTLDQTEAAWASDVAAGRITRGDAITWARDKAAADGVELGGFHAVAVVLNRRIGASGNGTDFLCGDDGLNPQAAFVSPHYLAHEMGHVYGLGDAQRESVAGIYTDPTDIMSVGRAHSAPHPVHSQKTATGRAVFRIGPGLNAASMAALGWLDETRTFTLGPGRTTATVDLRPLHRRDLPGVLAIRFGSWFVEYRSAAGWDAELDPGVLVHRIEDDASIIVPADDGALTFKAGSTLSLDPKLSLLGAGYSLAVLSVDQRAEVATLRLSRTQPELPEQELPSGPFQTPWIKWSDVVGPERDLVVVDGQALTLPQSSVMHRILRQVALHRSGAGLGSPLLRRAIRREALSGLAQLATEALAAEGPGLPQPGPDLAAHPKQLDGLNASGAGGLAGTVREEVE